MRYQINVKDMRGKIEACLLSGKAQSIPDLSKQTGICSQVLEKIIYSKQEELTVFPKTMARLMRAFDNQQ